MAMLDRATTDCISSAFVTFATQPNSNYTGFSARLEPRDCHHSPLGDETRFENDAMLLSVEQTEPTKKD
jgi:hypothetical protein